MRAPPSLKQSRCGDIRWHAGSLRVQVTAAPLLIRPRLPQSASRCLDSQPEAYATSNKANINHGYIRMRQRRHGLDHGDAYCEQLLPLINALLLCAAVCARTTLAASCPPDCSCVNDPQRAGGLIMVSCHFGTNSLLSLDWSLGDITSLPPGVLDNLTLLTDFALSGNLLSSIPSNLFDKTVKLKIIMLSNNLLTSLPPGLFDKTVGLDTIHLESNSLASLPAGLFDNLKNVTTILLSDNRLTSLPATTFAQNTRLSKLELNINRLTSIPSTIFKPLTALTALKLSQNPGLDLPSGIFDTLTNLQSLSIGSLQLTSLRPGVFDALVNLNNLELQNNNLTTLPSGLFAKTSKLSTVTFTSNQIRSIPPDLFGSGTLPLSRISFYDNKLTTVPPGLFDKFSATLSGIAFDYNNISTFPMNIFSKLTPASLTLGNNPGNRGNRCANSSSHCIPPEKVSCESCFCSEGWTGSACTVRCGVGLWGADCRELCACQNGAACSRFVGACNCTVGWTGAICDQPCTGGTYGANCSLTCPCKNGAACDRFTGNCTCTTPLWTGSDCSVPLKPAAPAAAVVAKSANSISIRLCPSNDTVCPLMVYEIERIGCPPADTVRVDATSSMFIDSRGITPGLRYGYSIKAYNPVDVLQNTFSEASTLPIVTAGRSDRPDAAADVVAAATLDAAGSVAVRLSWVADTSSGPVLSTRISRNGVHLIVVFQSSYMDASVIPGEVYTYTVWNRNANGESAESHSNTVTAVGQSVSVVGGGSGTSAASIAGAVVGSVLGAALVVLGITYYVRRRAVKRAEIVALRELELIDKVERRPETADLEVPGDRIVLLSKIGEGEFGEVYRAEVDLPSSAGRTKTVAAVKMFKLAPTASVEEIRSARSAFLAEIDLMRQCTHHPHVVELLGINTRTPPNGMILEYAAHGDLRNFVQTESKRLTTSDLLCFCIDIARGMEHLASLRIIHRDLAARNCMCFAGPRPPNPQEKGWRLSAKASHVTVKVADFGLSRDGASDYYTGKTRRKLPVKWMAPECMEKRLWTHASDVWSYGVTAWEVFSRGTKPYPGIDNTAVLPYLQQGNRMTAPVGCPADVFAVIETCWKKHPETRPAFDKIVLYLRRAMIGGPRQGEQNDRAADAGGDGYAVERAGSGTAGKPLYVETIPDGTPVATSSLYVETEPDPNDMASLA